MRPVSLASILAIVFCTSVLAQQITLGAADIGGVVSGAKGPEAGVWVIAETTDLPVRFARIVVTDERGRYLNPDLPREHVPMSTGNLNERLIAFKDGKGSAPLAAHFQLRPDPLAR